MLARRVVLALLVAALPAACGKGAPGGFSAPRPTAPKAVSTTNTVAQGSPALPPTSGAPAGDVRVTVTLAKGGITSAVREVRAGKVSFVVSNDDDAERSMHLATPGGTALAGFDRIRPGTVLTLSVELVAGRYKLVAEGGGKSPASADLTVSP